MKDDSSQSGLKQEWSLLIHSFLEDDSNKLELVDKMKSSELSVERIKSIKKELSAQRKKMNQAIEKIKIKIEQVNTVIENLKLVGSDASGLMKEIDFLSNEGEKISEEVLMLDQKIKRIHELQEMSAA
jgi:methyl-accepting chemotaxis protein